MACRVAAVGAKLVLPVFKGDGDKGLSKVAQTKLA